MIIWNFLGDPYGMDSTGTYTWTNRYIGHLMSRANVIVNNKSVAVAAEGVDLLATVKDPVYDHNVQEAAWFAGKYAPGPGNTWQQHPAVFQSAAQLSDRQFFWDIRPFIGGNLVAPVTAGCDPTKANWPTAGGCAAARVAGKTNVYKMVVTDGSANQDGLNPKHYALWGVAKTSVLRDVSGPGSVLDDSAAKDYTFCYALIANECVTGSAAGELYVQVPNLAVFYCTGGEGYGGGNDVCVSDFMFTGNALSQYGWAGNNKEGVDPTQISNPNLVGSAWTREIASHGLHLEYRQYSAFSTGKALTNGKWIVAADVVETPLGRGLLALVKVPSMLKDSRNRATFQPITIKIGSVPAGTDNVAIRFGYSENGSPGQFYCAARAEACVAVGSSISEASPFFWVSESFSGLSCASGCSPVIPALAGHVVWYQISYRNASNTEIAAGGIEAVSAY
jgi:hypothetical protein